MLQSNRFSYPAIKMDEFDKPGSYEWECFQVLAYEFPDDDPSDAERKIKTRLRRKKLGQYDSNRIATLRQLKNALQQEVAVLCGNSQYYLGLKGTAAGSEDFDFARMVKDFRGRFPNVPRDEIARAVSFAVFIYYVR